MSSLPILFFILVFANVTLADQDSRPIGYGCDGSAISVQDLVELADSFEEVDNAAYISGTTEPLKDPQFALSHQIVLELGDGVKDLQDRVLIPIPTGEVKRTTNMFGKVSYESLESDESVSDEELVLVMSSLDVAGPLRNLAVTLEEMNQNCAIVSIVIEEADRVLSVYHYRNIKEYPEKGFPIESNRQLFGPGDDQFANLDATDGTEVVRSRNGIGAGATVLPSTVCWTKDRTDAGPCASPMYSGDVIMGRAGETTDKIVRRSIISRHGYSHYVKIKGKL